MKDKELTLLVMAGGLGSRFGGLKQIEKIGPNGEFITDYSVYDAVLTGIKKIVFVIKKENFDIFKQTIGKRISDNVDVYYAFQEDEINYQGKIYKREKPWGTAHAILSAKELINGNFMIVNSDDFYGRDAFLTAGDYLKNNDKYNEFAFVGYKVENTLSENGSVKRGVCEVKDNYLTNIIESKIEKHEDKIMATPLDSDEEREIYPDDIVSMNMFLFTPYIFELLEEKLGEFIEKNKNDLTSVEYLIPNVVKEGLEEGKIKVRSLSTDSKWEGVTYKEDKEQVVKSIRNLIKEGEYKENLWQK